MTYNLVSLLSILVMAVGFLNPNSASALSCAMPSLQEMADRSTAVMKVTVTEIGINKYAALARVDKSWTGPAVGQIVKVESGPSAGWGLSFVKGKSYLLFATGNNPYQIGVCDGSRSLISQSDIANAKTDSEKEYNQYWYDQQQSLLDGTGPESLNSLNYRNPARYINRLPYGEYIAFFLGTPFGQMLVGFISAIVLVVLLLIRRRYLKRNLTDPTLSTMEKKL